MTVLRVLFCLAVVVLTCEAAPPPQDPTQLLRSQDADERESGAQILAEQASLSAPIVDLLQMLVAKDESPNVRAASCHALGVHQAAASTTIPILIRRCSDQGTLTSGGYVHDVAGAALAMFKGQSIPTIKKMLRSDDPAEVVEAEFALNYLGPFAADAVEDLIPLLESQQDKTLTGAINAIVKIGPPAKAAVPALTKILDHENFHYQYWSCRALGAIGPDAAKAAARVTELLQKGNASVRRNAAAALGKIGAAAGDKAVDALITALDDPTQTVKINAVVALGEMAPTSKRAEQTIRFKLSEAEFNARPHAAMSLWRLSPGDKQARAIILNELQDTLAPYEAVEVIAEIGAEMNIVAEIAELLTHKNAVTRESAVMALGSLGAASETHLAALRSIAEQDQDEEVREVARGAADKITAALKAQKNKDQPK